MTMNKNETYQNLFETIARSYNTNFADPQKSGSTAEKLSSDHKIAEEQITGKFYKLSELETAINSFNKSTFDTEDQKPLGEVYAFAGIGYQQETAKATIESCFETYVAEADKSEKNMQENPLADTFDGTLNALIETRDNINKYDNTLPRLTGDRLKTRYSILVEDSKSSINRNIPNIEVESPSFLEHITAYKIAVEKFNDAGYEFDSTAINKKVNEYVESKTWQADGLIDSAYDLANATNSTIRNKTMNNVVRAYQSNIAVYNIAERLGVDTSKQREELDKTYEFISTTYQAQLKKQAADAQTEQKEEEQSHA